MTEDQKMKAIGSAVTQLERELIDEGRSYEAGKLVSAFAALPSASMARLYNILKGGRSMTSEQDAKAIRIYERLIASAEAREHKRINETLAPVAYVAPWEVVVMTVTAAFIGFILVAL